MTTTISNEQLVYDDLKKFYLRKIKETANHIGYRKLSANLGHDENFVNTVIRRDAFGAIRRLYNEIKLAGYLIE